MRVFCDEKKTWYGAEKDCSTRGAKLARIPNSERNSWISSQTPDEVWFDAKDEDEEGVWTDSSGAVLSYTNWYQSDDFHQPDNYGNYQHCASVNFLSQNGKWDDVACNHTSLMFCYACEFGT